MKRSSTLAILWQTGKKKPRGRARARAFRDAATSSRWRATFRPIRRKLCTGSRV